MGEFVKGSVSYPIVEGFRSEIQGASFDRLNDADLTDLRARLFEAQHNVSIDGIYPSGEVAALLEMFLEERAPLSVSEPYLDRYFHHRVSS